MWTWRSDSPVKVPLLRGAGLGELYGDGRAVPKDFVQLPDTPRANGISVLVRPIVGRPPRDTTMPHEPDLTPDQRRRQAAAILARGVLRHLRAAKLTPSAPPPESSSNCLEVSRETPLHGGTGSAG